MKRRNFLTIAALTAASSCSRTSPAPGLRVLSGKEARTLEAWVERLIPTDQDAGAREAGVVHFIDRLLAGWLKRKRQPWKSALEGIDRGAFLAYAKPFYELEPKRQIALLEQMEAGKASREAFPDDGGKAAFELVLSYTMMGFYGNPRHGGNRDYVSWQMLGVPAVPVRGRRHRDEAALVENEKPNSSSGKETL